MKKMLALMLALTAISGISPNLRAEERAGVAEKYKWNMADLYAGDEAWQAAKENIAGRIPQMTQFQGKLGESADGFHSALSAMMDLDLAITRMAVYASMRHDEDTRVGKTREMDQIAQDLAVKFSAAVSYFRPEILALGSAKVMGFVSTDKRLEPYKPWLDDILRYEAHTLSAPEEKIAATAGMLSDAPGAAYKTFTNADLPYPEITLASGEKVRLDAQGYTKYRASADRADRDKVFQAFWGKYKEFERTLGATLNSHIKTHLFNKEVHKFSDSLEAGLFGANVPASVYKQLISDVHANLPTLHRYLKLRQKMMGIDQLRYEDLYASIVKKVDMRYTPEEAQDLVLKALSPLGPQYTNDLKSGFEKRWVDWIPTTGKRSGAYSTGVYGVHPYQLQNFTGLYEEVSTLAHESGHSMHSFLSAKNQPYVTSDYKTFVAEVASTLNENLLTHYMLDHTKDKDTKLFLLGSYLDGLRTTLFRQTLFAEFEMRIHELAEKGGTLTGEKLTELYLSLLKEYYGDTTGVCKINDLYGIEWAYIPHFYYNFYVYQYATSITASAQIAANIRAEASLKKPTAKSRGAYLKMLSSGSSKYPIELLKDAGVDMTTSGPFNAAIKEMNDTMDQMEKLLAQ
ncbi:MAG: oligoendopeptidase F [Elusimicrobia bacterium]|nr:oligoendopeptidase F [Elusimicrobiota bacterium]